MYLGKHIQRKDEKSDVILSERERVEGSTHFVDLCSKIGARILRLAVLAQDDMSFLCAYCRSCL